MAELTSREKLQPSLLDRLTDDRPQEDKESRERRVLSLERLRESVTRDLGWLLNTGALGAIRDLSDYPQVESSVLNYGMRDLAGLTSTGIDVVAIERMLEKCIIDFEPRILQHTLKVRAVVIADQMDHNAVTFEISGELWAQPIPLQLFLRTEIDLEDGSVRVQEARGD